MKFSFPSRQKSLSRWFVRQIKLVPFSHFLKNRSYSQKFEDLLISGLVGDKIGSYVDVGSGLPCFGSNTYLFYKRGWRGILVDPIPRNIALSKIFRRGDVCLNMGVGEEDSIIDFFLIDPYEFSTFDSDLAHRRLTEQFATLKKIVQIPVRPLSEILASRIFPHPILLSVDTEGFEMQVLKGIDWMQFKPDIICIEEFQNPIQNATPVKLYLQDIGYSLTYYTGLSSIYTLDLK